VLAAPRLRRIILAYTVNRLGTWMGVVALMVTVFDHTHSALAVAALMFASQALPAVVVPAVIARVEASKRHREITALYVFEAVVTAMLAAVLMWQFSLAAVLVLAAVDGTAALAASALLRAETARAAREHARMHPAEGAAELQLELDAEAERKGNAALNVAFSASYVLGPALGGGAVVAAGAPATLLIDAASFLLCGALLLDLHPSVEEAAGDSVRARLKAVWRHINETRRLRALLLAETIAFIFSVAAGPIEVAYAKATLHAGDSGLGLLLSTWGAGAVIGSLLFSRTSRALAVTLSAGTLAIGAAYVGFAAAPSLLVACGAALVGGAGNGVELPSFISLLQRLAPPRLHGRVMGAFESLGALALAIGFPLGGALVAISSSRAAFVVVGAVTAATAPALLLIGRAARASEQRDATPSQADGAPRVGMGVGHEHATQQPAP
jgi:Major Facilitator Superfamily